MSCPDWQTLVDQRDTASGAAGSGDADSGDAVLGRPADWHAALKHLDNCSECQVDAIAADPTLLFRRLPVPEFGDTEVETMQRAVASMRRSAKVEERRRPAFALPSAGPWIRAAAVTLVLLGSAVLHGTDPRGGDAAIDSESSQVAEVGESVQPAPGLPAVGLSMAARSVSRLPLVEMADPSYGSIIEVVDQDISVVVVLPGNLDV